MAADAAGWSSKISIHALREEGDLRPSVSSLSGLNFYPRPPRGGRPPAAGNKHAAAKFLSTPSARRATLLRLSFADCGTISIHALREEGDLVSCCTRRGVMSFLSTPSARRATRSSPRPSKASRFLSTPSARRATVAAVRGRAEAADFYPRPPRGGRQQKQRQNLYFQTNYTTFCTNLEEP